MTCKGPGNPAQGQYDNILPYKLAAAENWQHTYTDIYNLIFKHKCAFFPLKFIFICWLKIIWCCSDFETAKWKWKLHILCGARFYKEATKFICWCEVKAVSHLFCGYLSQRHLIFFESSKASLTSGKSYAKMRVFVNPGSYDMGR